MLKLNPMLFTVLGAMFMGSSPAFAEEGPDSANDLQLSREVQGMLQEEMREITVAIQAVAVSLATGNWESIEAIGENIRASYVMEKNLTDSQKHELEEKLPDYFKRLDAEFHARAEKLGLAAAAHDPEAVAFQYYRLVEGCTTCHAAFAQTRFPGFSAPSPQEHSH